jgi:serine protease SohB
LEFLAEYGLFLAKAITFVVAVIFVVGAVVSLSQKTKKHQHGDIEITNINQRLEAMSDAIESEVYSKEWLKARHKDDKKKSKQEKKKNKQNLSEESKKPRVYVLNFDGDIRASAVASLRQEITAVLSTATAKDEVVIKLESPGGLVHSYGLAASQLQRIKNKGVPLTVCVDKVAASGGYMMACIADKILAAPFAIVGSIGVVAQLPNFHKALAKHDIDFEVLTAGEYKRTLTIFGENTDKGRQKFIEDLEETHLLFKEWVSEHRSEVDIEDVAKGEVWYGQRAKAKALVDEVQTSDDYIVDRCSKADVYEVKYHEKKSLAEKIGISMATVFEEIGVKFSKWLMGPKH